VAHAPTRPLRILVADDDAAYCDLVCRTLARSFRGSTVEATPDGAAALTAALRARPDLVVTDLDMPLMNGVELVAEIRARAELADVPVIVLSAVGGSADWSLLGRLGASAFIGKPFDAQQLASVAHAVAG
jgi:serine/threonine-protein kinase